MKRKIKINRKLPDVCQIEAELRREVYKKRRRKTAVSTVSVLAVAAAAAILISNLLFPVLKIYGTSMTPSLTGGDIIIASRGGEYERENIIAFYYNNKILVKRVIGMPGELIEIDGSGEVSINGEPLEETYLTEKSLGECDMEFPYQIPEGRYFVMGDHRSVSSDSRNSAIGCIAEEQIIGRLAFKIWPLSGIGAVK